MATRDDLSIDPEDAANSSLVNEQGSSAASPFARVFSIMFTQMAAVTMLFRAGNWVVPNDEAEQNRMDLLHHVWKSVLDGECLRFGGRAAQVNRVLDVGTGTGLWAIDMADAYPTATVVGTDLSPIQPGWIPPNCFFFVDDAEQSPWEFEELFDVIHLRNMEGAFRDWGSIYRHILENIRPGGIVEVQSQDMWIYSLDKKIPDIIIEWLNMLLGASRRFGRELDVSRSHKRLIEEAGFTNVEQVEYKMPIGPWAKQNKHVGEVFLAVVLESVESYSLELFTRVLHISLQEVQKMIKSVQQALMNMSNHLYAIHIVVTGRKPLSV